MEAIYANGCFFVDDDLLNFSLDEEDEEPHKHHHEKTTATAAATTTTTTTTTPTNTPTVKEHSLSSSFSLESSDHHPVSHQDDDVHLHNHSFPECVEEELEWLSNKDAFPGVETYLEIFSDNPGLALDHHSPVSVLENSSSSSDSKTNGNGNGTTNDSTISSCCGGLHVPRSYPVGKRSKRRRSIRRSGFPDLPSGPTQQSLLLNHVNAKTKNQEQALPLSPITKSNSSNNNSIGRRCLHCLAEKTPQWRAGPMGPKTLCNACGVRYKSGRLVPEYRPACSPTFSASVHSNSHRKIMEMRRQKQIMPGGMAANQACGYRVG